METYGYAPLEDVSATRLLKVLPGVDKDDILCTLVVPDDDEPFEALSYCWGPDRDYPMATMTLRTATGPKTLPVTANLQSAVRHLRHPDRPRMLWIDAVCINQRDQDEKNAQVPQMGKLYQRANNVCVWLGEEERSGKRAMDFVKTINRRLEDVENLLDAEADWKAFSDLMRRPWFARRWVVQEIALARKATVHCGTQLVEWSDFEIAVDLFQSYTEDIIKHSRRTSALAWQPDFASSLHAMPAVRLVDATQNLFYKSDEGDIIRPLLNLETLVSNLIAFECTLPHHAIYAILSLAKDADPTVESQTTDRALASSQIASTSDISDKTKLERAAKLVFSIWKSEVVLRKYRVDYRTPFVDAAKYFLSFILERTKSLDILCRPWAPPSQSQLPSWIPSAEGAAFGRRYDGTYSRLHADPLVSLAGGNGNGNGNARTYSASGSMKAHHWSFGEGIAAPGPSLFVKGFVLDTVERETIPAVEGSIPPEWARHAGWTDLAALPPGLFWRTIVADRGPGGGRCPNFYRQACLIAYRRSAGGILNTQELLTRGISSTVAEFVRRVQAVVWWRKLVLTARGRVGLAPKGARPGDSVCILYGCSVPVVLRKVAKVKPEVGVKRRRLDNDDDYDESGSQAFTQNVNDAGDLDAYEVVGDCYMHGMMHGEAISLQLQQEIPTTIFELH